MYPTSLGNYRVLSELGRGGMGVVYRAQDPVLDREVAIKVLTVPQPSAEDRRRFLQEAQAAARLRHPGLVGMHHVGLAGEQPYLVMDLIEGTSLAERLRQGPLGLREGAQLVEALARALAYAHRKGLLHRDVKPANVLLDGEQPVLTDFGVVRILGATRMTSTGDVLGTPSFMAPEQAGDAKAVGEATDVYGLGATLYATLTGQPPFTGSVVEVLNAVLESSPRPPRELRPDIDPDLAAICLRCLEKDPGARYPSAGAVADALRSWSTEPPQRTSNNRLVGVLSVALLLSLVVSAVLGWRLAVASEPEPVERDDGPLITARTERDRAQAEVETLQAEVEDLRRTKRDAGIVLAAIAKRRLALRSRKEKVATLAIYDRALALDPTNPMAFSNRAVLKMNLGDPDGAAADLDQGLALAPNNPAILYNRARLRKRLGDLKGMLADMNRVVKLRPNLTLAWLDRAWVRLELDQLDLAYEDLQQALRRDGERMVDTHHWLGRYWEKRGNVEKALQSYARALQLLPSHGTLLRERGLLRERTGDIDGAIADYQRALVVMRAAPWAPKLRARLRRLQGRRRQ